IRENKLPGGRLFVGYSSGHQGRLLDSTSGGGPFAGEAPAERTMETPWASIEGGGAALRTADRPHGSNARMKTPGKRPVGLGWVGTFRKQADHYGFRIVICTGP